jgi:anti-anti-sigma factor
MAPVIRLQQHDRDGATVYLSGDVDVYVGGILDRVLADVAANRRLSVECADVDFIDSTGFRALMFHWNRLHAGGGRLRLTNPSPAVRRVVELFGVDDLLF